MKRKPFNRLAFYVILPVAMLIFFSSITVRAQDQAFKQFDAPMVFDSLDSAAADSIVAEPLVESWWDPHVTGSFRSMQPLPTDIHTLLYLALKHSNQIKIAKREPLIAQTAIQEADSSFDWIKYLDSAWNDTSEPISNQLQAGGTATQFNDHTFQTTAGVRKLNRLGGLLDLSQRLGWQNNNSQFFIPADQATGQLTLSYTQPLFRGRGRKYNEALVLLAQYETKSAAHNFLAALQEELLEITRSYWSLYRERAVMAHNMRLFLQTQQIYKTLEARQRVDTQRTQLITAASALENRRAELIRSRTAVTNAETRLRGLINAPELSNSDQAELVPIEVPSTVFQQTDLASEIQVALKNRSEIQAAVQTVRAGAKRLEVAKHELLPQLNLVTQAYTNGLRGNSNFNNAWTDQFTRGAPSYSVGLQYEMPVGNRLAKAAVCRRRHEVARLRDEYARAVEAVQTEVDIAVREMNTAHREIAAKSRALMAAEAEANTIQQRWLRLVDGSGSAALNLESLLRAQERVTAAEADYITSVLTYNLAMISLKRANGTLLTTENVSVDMYCQDGCEQIELSKGNFSTVPTPASIPTHLHYDAEPVAPQTRVSQANLEITSDPNSGQATIQTTGVRTSIDDHYDDYFRK